MKSFKSIIIFLLTAFILVGAITFVVNTSSDNTSYTNVDKTPTRTDTIPSYTLAQVATHSNTRSCWSIVGTNVYDLTSWINQHPGGPEAILGICGKDATIAFENQHGGQRRPANELQGLLIGTYKQ